MSKLLLVVCAAAGVAGCGSSTSPVQYCKNLQTAVCARVFACNDPSVQATADFQDDWGTSQADCSNKLVAQNCASETNDNPCGASDETYHADKADACVADLKAESCPDFMNHVRPDSCSAVCS